MWSGLHRFNRPPAGIMTDEKRAAQSPLFANAFATSIFTLIFHHSHIDVDSSAISEIRMKKRLFFFHTCLSKVVFFSAGFKFNS